jgi:beta-glucanase (GH16 family)
MSTKPVSTPTPRNDSFLDNLDAFDPQLFSISDGWTNGSIFNNGWRADHATFADGFLTLTLDNLPCPSGCSQMPYASAEYRTNKLYSFGRVEARFKPFKAVGAMSGSLFTYTGPSDGNPWDEIDIEFLGKDTTKVQLNYFTDGQGNHEKLLDLGFDAADDYHTYAFEWNAESIKWYVDGRLVHTETGTRGPLPTHPGRIMVNTWPGIGLDGWLGSFSYKEPLSASYDWISYTPLP